MAEYAQYVKAFASALLSCNGRDAIANGGSSSSPCQLSSLCHSDVARVAARTVAALLQTGNAEVRRAVEQVSLPGRTGARPA